MEKLQKFHFIGLGKGPMTDLAVALKHAGHTISGSDESIAASPTAKLIKAGLVPDGLGWFPEKVDPSIHGVILAPDITADNIELKRALELKLPVSSFPEFIYQQSIDKQRMVIAGSYGKTMITGLIIHVLDFHKRKFDYVINAAVPGMESQIRLSHTPLIVIESLDAKASVLDPTPSFLKYRHHIGVIPGIEWQESASYPTKEEYVRQFSLFGAATPKGGILIYFELDPVVAALSKMDKPDVSYIPYKTHPSDYQEGQELLMTPDKRRVPVKISGKHNFQNISAAQEALRKIGIASDLFYQAISSFEGIRS